MGGFISFYTGEFWDEAAFEKRMDAKRAGRYAISTSDELVVSPPLFLFERPPPERYPFAMVNESSGLTTINPPSLQSANAYLMEYTFGPEDLDADADDYVEDRRFTALGLVACTNISAGAKILWNYYRASVARTAKTLT